MSAERVTTIRLTPIDVARVDALLRAGVVNSFAEAVRYGLRTATVKHRLEVERTLIESARIKETA